MLCKCLMFCWVFHVKNIPTLKIRHKIGTLYIFWTLSSLCNTCIYSGHLRTMWQSSREFQRLKIIAMTSLTYWIYQRESTRLPNFNCEIIEPLFSATLIAFAVFGSQIVLKQIEIFAVSPVFIAFWWCHKSRQTGCMLEMSLCWKSWMDLIQQSQPQKWEKHLRGEGLAGCLVSVNGSCGLSVSYERLIRYTYLQSMKTTKIIFM